MKKKDKKPIKNSTKPIYHNCGKTGHFKTKYFKKKKDDKEREKKWLKAKKSILQQERKESNGSCID